MSDKIFLVFREGVYRHELCGVDSDRRQAEACADYFALSDTDDYHEYVVYETALDRRGEIGEVTYISPNVEEAMEGVYSVRRSVALKASEARYMNSAELDRLDALRQDAEERA